VDKIALQKMQSYVDGKEVHISPYNWPAEILDEKEGIWVNDFFWARQDIGIENDEFRHDLELLGIESFDCGEPILKERVWTSRCVQWLVGTLKNAPNQELYFGGLTQALHESLEDDPTPYRKDVKVLIQNMISYCEKYIDDRIEVSRPNFSQKIKLIRSET